jgi:hypothetical protein
VRGNLELRSMSIRLGILRKYWDAVIGNWEQLYDLPHPNPLPGGEGAREEGGITMAIMTNTAIESDITCIKCGYNLRGLSSNGLCPECGNGIAISLQGRKLSDADPAWRRKLSNGARLQILFNSMSLFTVLRAIALNFHFTDMTRNLPGRYFVWQMTILGVLDWTSVWLLTAPEPIQRPIETLDLRQCLRIVCTCLMVSSIFDLIFTGSGRSIFLGVFFVGRCALVAGTFCLFYVYLIRLTQRIPSPTLVLEIKILVFSKGIFLAGYYAVLFSLRRFTTLYLIDLVKLGTFLSLIFGAWLIWIMVRLNREFRVQLNPPIF